MHSRGLNAYRESVQINLMDKIKEALLEDLKKFVMVEQHIDPLTGIMYVKASLRLLEPSDGQMMKFAYVPLGEEQMRLR